LYSQVIHKIVTSNVLNTDAKRKAVFVNRGFAPARDTIRTMKDIQWNGMDEKEYEEMKRDGTLWIMFLGMLGLMLGMLFVACMIPTAFAAGEIIQPVTSTHLDDINTSFLFQTDDSVPEQWVMFDGGGTEFCGDSINGYGSPVSRTMNDWAIACGLPIVTDTGTFHILVVDSRSGPCTTGGNYTDCKASIYYTTGDDIEINISPAEIPAGESGIGITLANQSAIQYYDPSETIFNGLLIFWIVFLGLAFYFK